MRLYVDVDDTLILWPKVDESRHLISGDAAWGNEAVRLFALRWKAYNPSGEIIVWSLGGADYARMWAARVGLPYSYAMSKQPVVCEKGDLFIDDDPLECYRESNIHPDMLKGVG